VSEVTDWIFEPGNPCGVTKLQCIYCGSEIGPKDGLFYRRVVEGEITLEYEYACFKCGEPFTVAG
jgi:DNA-directed RNA polymerase subunit RPC12/RpoP